MTDFLLIALLGLMFWKPAYHFYKILKEDNDEHHADCIRHYLTSLKNLIFSLPKKDG